MSIFRTYAERLGNVRRCWPEFTEAQAEALVVLDEAYSAGKITLGEWHAGLRRLRKEAGTW